MTKQGRPSDLEFIRKIKSIALKSLFSDDTILENLVLKGGNALDLGFNASTRSSLDLDLSMNEPFESDTEFELRIRSALEDGFAREQYRVVDLIFVQSPLVSRTILFGSNSGVATLLTSRLSISPSSLGCKVMPNDFEGPVK